MKNFIIFITTFLLVIMSVLLIRTLLKKSKEYQQIANFNKEDLKINNVVLIIACSLRADHLSCYGYERKTSPNIDKLAKEGILFKNCFSQAPFTAHSVPSIMTSKYPRKLFGVDHDYVIIPDHAKTIAEFFREAGFYTMGFMANPWISKPFNFDQGFDYFYDTSELLKNYTTEKDRLANRVWGKELTNKIGEQLKGLKDNFFLQILFIDNHDPYESHPPFRGKFSFDKQNIQMVNRYDETILNLDYYIGKLVETLRTLNLLDNTLIIFTSDHGDGFGKFHKYDRSHAYFLYNTVIKIPLIIYSPSLHLAGVTINNYVTPMDILPTVLDLIGIQYAQKDFDGVSQTAAFSKVPPSDTSKRLIFSETNFMNNKSGMIRSCIMINQRWKLIHNYQTSLRKQKLSVYELYDLTTDPNEKNNLANEKQEVVNELVLLLEDWQKNNTLSPAKDKINQAYSIENIPPELEMQLKALGYLN